MSFGIDSSEEYLSALQAITDSGKIVFLALGNSGNKHESHVRKIIKASNDARFKGRLVLVASTSYDEFDTERLSKFSDRAVEKTNNVICAPGDMIHAPYQGKYKAISGTSMATPVTSGAFLLLKSALVQQFGKNSFSNDEVLSYLKESARSQSINDTIVLGAEYGEGVIDVESAFKMASLAYKPKKKSVPVKQSPKKAKKQKKRDAAKPAPVKKASVKQEELKPKVKQAKKKALIRKEVKLAPQTQSWSSYFSEKLDDYVVKPAQHYVVQPAKRLVRSAWSYFGY